MQTLEREILTPEQVADYLQVQPRTVLEWLRTGRLPGAKIGRLWRVRRHALEGFLRLRSITSGDPDLETRPLRDYDREELAAMMASDRLPVATKAGSSDK